jgi:hypothetical protein
VLLRVAEVHRIDDHLDVGRVLAGVAPLRDVDELDRRLVERDLELAVALPVGVGALDDDLALLEQSPEDEMDIEVLVLGAACASDVLEVDQDGDLALVGSSIWLQCASRRGRSWFPSPGGSRPAACAPLHLEPTRASGEPIWLVDARAALGRSYGSRNCTNV